MTSRTAARLLLVALLACCTGALAASMPAQLQVQLTGAVARAGALTLKGQPRLSDAALAAQPLPSAYMLGAAWLRASLYKPQLRLKAGVLFDLATLKRRARAHDQLALVALAERLQQRIRRMPATGRQPALLDPRAVEINPPQNLPLADGDRLFYPVRPATVRVVGAVMRACTLPLMPMQDARAYLSACPTDADADADTIAVIEPDGRVFAQGVALWNRSPARVLAPGALIYVPLGARAVSLAGDPSLNDDMAAFFATQLLPGPVTP